MPPDDRLDSDTCCVSSSLDLEAYERFVAGLHQDSRHRADPQPFALRPVKQGVTALPLT